MSKPFLFCNSNKSDMFHLILAVWIWCTFKFCAVEFIKMGGLFLKKILFMLLSHKTLVSLC